MKKITINSKLYGKKQILVDNEDYSSMLQHTWYIIKGVNTFYAVSNICRNGWAKRIWMHREILNDPTGKVVDHKDGNGLNNQKNNLRACTRRENGRNRKSHKGSSSKYLGVSLNAKRKHGYRYWTANIRDEKRLIWLGQFPFTKKGEIEAAKKYDEKAKEIFGEFANLNFK